MAERSAKASTDEAAQELLKKLEMREETERQPGARRDPLAANVRCLGLRGALDGQGAARACIVDLRTANGRVTPVRPAGRVHASTVNGGIEGKGLASRSSRPRTTNGGVEVELTGPLSSTGSVSLEAVNGGVSLALPEGSQASVTARVTNGGVNTTGLDFQLTGEQTRRRFEGTLNGGGARVDAANHQRRRTDVEIRRT